METIYHQVGIKSSLEKITQALGSIEGLARWWTSDTRGSTQVGEHIEFWFGEHCVKAEVLETDNPNIIAWRVIADEGEWKDTVIRFELKSSETQITINFSHEQWQAVTDLFRHCATKWAVFLLSLKNYLEQGEGKPYPNDIPINHY